MIVVSSSVIHSRPNHAQTYNRGRGLGSKFIRLDNVLSLLEDFGAVRDLRFGLDGHGYEETKDTALGFAANRRSHLWIFCRQRSTAGTGESEGSNGYFRNCLRDQRD